MKRILFFLPVMIALFSIISFESCQSTKSATATKMLQFNFEKGKGYDYEMMMDIDQKVMGQPMKMGMSTYYSMDVTEDDGIMKTLTTRFDRFKMDMNVAGMDMTVDTDKKATADDDKNPMQMMNRIFGAIKGQQFTMKINKEGKVEEVSGFKEMAGAIADSMQLDEKERAEMIAKFNQQFNENGIKGQFERVLYIFPNKEVKVGDSWEKSTSVTGQMAGKYKSTYTVKEIEGDMVTLEEKTKIEGEAEGSDMDGKVSGILVVDSKSGLVVNADQDVVIEIKKNGQSIVLNAKNKIRGKVR
ncbi:MAG: DUF6263 family protein [Chitinophagaceae bacterium]